METLSYTFTNVDFKLLMKALFRKYLDESYQGKALVLDIDRKLLNKDELLIYRVHNIEYFFYNYYFLEKIIVNRKDRTYRSRINTRLYKEECFYDQIDNNVKYRQNYDTIVSLMKKGKKEVFENGCQVIERIVQKILRNEFI
jgi:hypothetical protein